MKYKCCIHLLHCHRLQKAFLLSFCSNWRGRFPHQDRSLSLARLLYLTKRVRLQRRESSSIWSNAVRSSAIMLFTSFCPRLNLELLKEQATHKVIRDTITPPLIRRGEIRCLEHHEADPLTLIIHSKHGCLVWGPFFYIRTVSFG